MYIEIEMEEKKMKNIKKVYEDCADICNGFNIPIAKTIYLKVNSRAKKRWGLCTLECEGEYTIEISDRLLADNVSEEATFNTMIHELLHTCPNCMNHGKEWKYWADVINRNTCYNIKRTTSCAEKGIENIPKTPKYTVTCNKCGRRWFYNRAGSVIQNVRRCKCPYCNVRSLECEVNR